MKNLFKLFFVLSILIFSLVFVNRSFAQDVPPDFGPVAPPPGSVPPGNTAPGCGNPLIPAPDGGPPMEVGNSCAVSGSCPALPNNPAQPPPPASAPVPVSGSCVCDGVSYEPRDFRAGDTIKVTAYAKVTRDNSNTTVKNILFSSGKKVDSNLEKDDSQVPVPASLISANRYGATWNYTVPADLEKGVPYYVWTDIDCSTRSVNGNSYSQIISSNDKEIPLTNSNFLQRIQNFFASLFPARSKQKIQSTPDQVNVNPTPAESIQIGTFNIGITAITSCRSIQIKKL